MARIKSGFVSLRSLVFGRGNGEVEKKKKEETALGWNHEYYSNKLKGLILFQARVLLHHTFSPIWELKKQKQKYCWKIKPTDMHIEEHWRI